MPKNRSEDLVAAREAIFDGTKHVSASIIHCSETDCDHSAQLKSNRLTGRLPDVVLRKKFQIMGWRMKGKKWLCPDHARHHHKSEAPSNVVELQQHSALPAQIAPVDIPAAPLPTQEPAPKKETTMVTQPTPLRSFADLATASIDRMTQSDRRRIFRAIDEQWDDDAGRYVGGAGDQGIATSLNVARAWVEHVRKEAFGDSAGNEDIDELRDELAELKGKVGVALEEMQQLQARMKDYGQQAGIVADKLHGYFTRINDLEKRLGVTERAVGVRR